MRRDISIAFLGLILLPFFMLQNISIAQEPPPQPDYQSHPKIDSVFMQLKQKYLENANESSFSVECDRRGIASEAFKVEVEIFIAPPNTTESLDFKALGELGFKTRIVSKNYIEGFAPIDRITEIAELSPEITECRRLSVFEECSYTSEGVSNIVGCTRWKNNGATGSGVVIAVIDLGFSGISSAVLNGDFGTYTSQDFTGSGFPGTSVHGTACAEVVYDVAPNATYHLLRISTNASVQNALSYCQSNSIDIISGSFGSAIFADGQGGVTNDVNNAESNGILPVFSSGNYADRQFWVGAWTDSDSDNWLEFSGTDESQTIMTFSTITLNVTLTWDSSLANSSEDYNLYVYDSTFSIVASSTNTQSGSQTPAESLSFTATAFNTYHIQVWRFSASGSSTFRLYVDQKVLEHSSSDKTLASPADSAGAFTVGAIDYNGWLNILPAINNFSSQGPTMDGRIKPDICGPDGVSTFTYGVSGFPGTSAAAPHVSGIAALYLQQYPSSTPAQIRSKLESWAYDCGTRGKDSVFGFGEVQLYNSPPIANFTGLPITIRVGDSVSFFDVSSGLVKNWAWTFGDSSTSTVQDPTHSYQSSGVFDVSLTASGPTGSDTKAKTGFVTVTPKADFTSNKRTGPGELVVAFSDVSIGTVTGWTWDFGDGSSSILQNPSHTYSSSGLFTVKLTITGPHGSDYVVKSDFISVSTPTCDFSANVTGGTGSLDVTFTPQTSGTVSSYNWDFGDGATSTIQSPSHSYTPGAYTVSLTVSGPTGTYKEEKTSFITVFTDPPTIITQNVESGGGGCGCSSKPTSAPSQSIIGQFLPFLIVLFAFLILRRPSIKCEVQQSQKK